ncbi:hypothetical protein GGR56DRAFT_644579 [Xylariaceae sp. FL0804]|nr:hypothetical protein GGR56DRAFT_644579 [Xylariaceae sp. FL0804]
MARKRNTPKSMRPKGPTPPQFRRGGGGSNFTQAHGYTLAEEAMNTAHNRRGMYGRDPGLRHKPVSFVSAGFMDPLKEFEVPREASNPTDTDVRREVEAEAPNAPGRGVVDLSLDDLVTATSEVRFDEEAASELSARDPVLDGNASPGVSQNPGPDSDLESDEEIIVFKGRDARRQEPKQLPHKQLSSLDKYQKPPELTPTEIPQVEAQVEVVTETIVKANYRERQEISAAEDFISLDTGPKRARRVKRDKASRTQHSTVTPDDDEAAIIADYIANMQNDDEEDEDDDDVELEDKHPGLGTHAFNVLRDLGGTDSDAIPDHVSSGDGLESGSDVEGEPEKTRRLESDDERLARMLAKQEELGLGSDDVILLDGEDSDDGWFAAPKNAPRRKKKGGSKKDRMVQQKGQFPSATKMAEAFDELDLMDWHRPSLQNFKKGPKSFNVSDSELEEAMNIAFEKDRRKKAEKKRAREELRSQGLLGKNVNPDDLRVKYHGGMSLDDLANEMEDFITGTREQLLLPPFDKATRKTIHTIANKFKIKSQSSGKGQARCPVLFRTKATRPFDQDVFDRTFGRIKQTWFPRVDVDEQVVNRSRILKREEARSGKSRFGKNALTIREGDIVGQHAAELGAENKGRAMLEKMGWSKGMSLGTGENQGIIVPLTHVMKKTKAGLGDA